MTTKRCCSHVEDASKANWNMYGFRKCGSEVVDVNGTQYTVLTTPWESHLTVFLGGWEERVAGVVFQFKFKRAS